MFFLFFVYFSHKIIKVPVFSVRFGTLRADEVESCLSDQWELLQMLRNNPTAAQVHSLLFSLFALTDKLHNTNLNSKKARFLQKVKKTVFFNLSSKSYTGFLFLFLTILASCLQSSSQSEHEATHRDRLHLIISGIVSRNNFPFRNIILKNVYL